MDINEQSKVYTTEELIEILGKEMDACMNGDRTFPMPEDADEVVAKHLIGAALGAEKLFQVGVYHEFREKVHEYQRQNQVSGLTVSTVDLGDQVIRFPEHESQLIVLDSDIDVLKAAKDRVVSGFVSFCRLHPEQYLYHTITGKRHSEWSMQTTVEYVEHFASGMDWASIHCHSVLGEEISLLLGYGDPGRAAYINDQDSDMFYFNLQKSCRWSKPVSDQFVTMSASEFAALTKELREKDKE